LVYPEKNKLHNVESIIKLITPKTKIIVLTSVYNLLGNTLDIKDLIKQTKIINHDITFILDATQSAPHTVTDVKDLGVDFMFCSAHKMCGPTGVGILYGKKQLLEQYQATKLGGGMNSIVEPTKFNFAPLPDKYEGGSPNCAGILGFGAAIKFLNEIDMIEVSIHEKKLKQYINQQFKTIKDLEYYSENFDYPICAFNIKGVHPQDLANYLGNNKIIVRGGVSCAKLQKYVTGVEAGFVRATFYLYSTKEDVDVLVSALKKFDRTKILDNIL
jgi:cysteine desulfurase/selenocysteine lyase